MCLKYVCTFLYGQVILEMPLTIFQGEKIHLSLAIWRDVNSYTYIQDYLIQCCLNMVAQNICTTLIPGARQAEGVPFNSPEDQELRIITAQQQLMGSSTSLRQREMRGGTSGSSRPMAEADPAVFCVYNSTQGWCRTAGMCCR